MLKARGNQAPKREQYTADQNRITRELLERAKEPYRKILAGKPKKKYSHLREWVAVQELCQQLDAMAEAVRGL